MAKSNQAVARRKKRKAKAAPAAAAPPPEARVFAVATDGNTAKLIQNTMGLYELKAILETFLEQTVVEINKLATGTPATAPAPPAEPVAEEKPAEPATPETEG